MGLFSSTPQKLRMNCTWSEKEGRNSKREHDWDIDMCGILINSQTDKYELISAKSGKSTYNYGGIIVSKDSAFGPQLKVDVLSHKFASQGNKESIDINLSKMDENYDIIVGLVSIYMGVTRNHKFGDIKNCMLDIQDMAKKRSLKLIPLTSKFPKSSDFIPFYYVKNDKDWEFKWCNLSYWENHTDDVVSKLVKQKVFQKLKN